MKQSLDELEATLKILAAYFAWALLFVSAPAAGDVDFSGPAPDEEIAAACDLIRSRFGSELYMSSVHQVSSGLINSQGEVTGYIVCFLYCPQSVYGSFAPLCVERVLDETYWNTAGLELPDCTERPGECEVRIHPTEAIQVALDHGLKSELSACQVLLRWEGDYEQFVWYVYERRREDVSDTSYLSDPRVFVIGARSADILKVRDGWR